MLQDVETSPLQTQLIECEAKRRKALVEDDMASLATLLADDLVHAHTTGIVHGKAELLGHAGGTLEFLDVSRGALNIRPLGEDHAVMTGPMTNTVRRRGVDETVVVQAFVTQVWARRNGAWQIVSFHAVRLPQPSQ